MAISAIYITPIDESSYNFAGQEQGPGIPRVSEIRLYGELPENQEGLFQATAENVLETACSASEKIVHGKVYDNATRLLNFAGMYGTNIFAEVDLYIPAMSMVKACAVLGAVIAAPYNFENEFVYFGKQVERSTFRQNHGFIMAHRLTTALEYLSPYIDSFSGDEELACTFYTTVAQLVATSFLTDREYMHPNVMPVDNSIAGQFSTAMALQLYQGRGCEELPFDLLNDFKAAIRAVEQKCVHGNLLTAVRTNIDLAVLAIILRNIDGLEAADRARFVRDRRNASIAEGYWERLFFQNEALIHWLQDISESRKDDAGLANAMLEKMGFGN